MPSGDPTVVDGRLCRTSPSSIEQLDRCETNWWLNYVGHIEEKVHPTTAFGQRVGQTAHAQLEDNILKGLPLTDPFARALAKYLPPVKPGLLVETATAPLLVAAGIPVKGRIDWTHGYLPKRPIVADWKTRKDLSKYQKTEEQLRADIQMNSYARWAIEYYPEAESIDVAHYYVETKRHVEKDSNGKLRIIDPGFEPATDRLLLNFSIDDTKAFWSNTVEPLVERMKSVAATPRERIHSLGHPEDMKSKESACNMFGGCPRKHACPHSPMNQLRARMAAATHNQEQKSMGLQDLLKQHTAAQLPATPAAPPPPNEGVVPPDAGSRTNPVKVEAKKLEPGDIAAAKGAIDALAAAPKFDPKVQCGSCGVPNGYAHAVSCSATAPAPGTPIDTRVVDGKVVDVEHKHEYDATGQCACGKKKPGRKAKAQEPAPLAEASKVDLAKAEMFAQQELAAAKARPGSVLTEEQKAENREALKVVESGTSAEDNKPQGIQVEGLVLFQNVAVQSSHRQVTDLTKYAHDAAVAIAKAAGTHDPRFVDKNNPLAYGAWKGALTEYVRADPPKGWCVIWTRGDEIAEVVAAALAPLAEVNARG